MRLPRVSAKTLTRFHLAATTAWGVLAVPTVLWWNQSILWVALMSVWANFAAHFSAYQGARGEAQRDDEKEN